MGIPPGEVGIRQALSQRRCFRLGESLVEVGSPSEKMHALPGNACRNWDGLQSVIAWSVEARNANRERAAEGRVVAAGLNSRSLWGLFAIALTLSKTERESQSLIPDHRDGCRQGPAVSQKNTLNPKGKMVFYSASINHYELNK